MIFSMYDVWCAGGCKGTTFMHLISTEAQLRRFRYTHRLSSSAPESHGFVSPWFKSATLHDSYELDLNNST